jgi:hypothetical protein
MRWRHSKAGVSALVLLLGCSSGCAAPSCPGVYLNPVVHVDATAWVDAVPTSAMANATICIESSCVTANPINESTPGDLLGALTLPVGKATVRVQLSTAGGRSLDRRTTTGVTATKPFGSGCAGRQEIDLAVTKDGSLVPGRPVPVS